MPPTEHDTLAIPQEFDENAISDSFKTTPRAPIRMIRIGKTEVPVPDKHKFWQMPPEVLRLRAVSVAIRKRQNPENPKDPADVILGKVIVYDEKGQMMARYADPKQAAAKLAAAGVDLSKLSGGKDLKGAKKGKKGAEGAEVAAES